MNRRIVWAGTARDDLLEILRYIAADNPPAATRVQKRIETSVARLGHFATGRRSRIPGIREKLVPRLPYILAYRIDRQADGAEHLTILRIIHTARDWPPGTWPE